MTIHVDKILLAISAAGLAVSGYLFVTYVSPTPLVCTEGGGCHAVRASEYATLAGLPMPLYGLLYYACLGILGARRMRATSGEQFLLTVLTGAAFAFSAWLTYLEAFVIDSWCTWCVASAILATIAFVHVWLHNNTEKGAHS